MYDISVSELIEAEARSAWVVKFPGHFQAISMTFPGHFQDISRPFPGHFQVISRTIPGHF